MAVSTGDSIKTDSLTAPTKIAVLHDQLSVFQDFKFWTPLNLQEISSNMLIWGRQMCYGMIRQTSKALHPCLETMHYNR